MYALRFLVQMVLAIALPLLVQRWDRERLTPAQRARVWNGASWGSAVYNFGELSMIGWYWVTRRWSPAALLGLPTSLALFVAIRWLVDQALADALGQVYKGSLAAMVGLWAIFAGAAVVFWALTLGWEAWVRWRRASRRPARAGGRSAPSPPPRGASRRARRRP